MATIWLPFLYINNIIESLSMAFGGINSDSRSMR